MRNEIPNITSHCKSEIDNASFCDSKDVKVDFSRIQSMSSAKSFSAPIKRRKSTLL